MTTPDFGDDVRFAHTLADAADAVSMERFKALDLQIETKPDLTPVTDADRTIEERIRWTLSRSRPRDAVLGEEFGASGQSARRWVIDPIDGTMNFVRGVPVWATLIGLMVDDVVVAGVVSAPRWTGAGGPPRQGAWSGRSLARAARCKVSEIATIGDASLSYSDLGGWEDVGRLEQFFRLSRRTWRTRAYGDFWSYVLVADGAVDIACEPALELHDMAAVSVVVEEAGGRFTSLDGAPGPHGGNALATNGRLHDDVLALLSPDGAPD